MQWMKRFVPVPALSIVTAAMVSATLNVHAHAASGFVYCTPESFIVKRDEPFWGEDPMLPLLYFGSFGQPLVEVQERRECPSSFAKGNCQSIYKPLSRFVEHDNRYTLEERLGDVERTLHVYKDDMTFVRSDYEEISALEFRERYLTLRGSCRFE